jgi:non-specific serine/threonine protein kinase
LRIRGEQMLPVEPLPVPHVQPAATPAALGQIDAVALFVERARAVRPSFALSEVNALVVADICRQLDGLPLAIELAAARLRVLSPEALLAQVTDRLRLLQGGPRDLPARQQTLQDTVGWSYGLLSDDDQRLFCCLAIFAGGWTLEAAAAVGALSQDETLVCLERLSDHSLIRSIENEDGLRFTMLETIRAYGLERLEETGQAASARDRHAAFFLQTAHEMEATHDVPRALRWIEQERPNLRAAIAHLDRPETAEHFLALVGDIANAWTRDGFALEARIWLERGLSHRELVSPRTRAWALAGLAGVLYQLPGETAAALSCGEQALALDVEDDWRSRGMAAHWCGLNALRLGQAERGEHYFRQAQAIESQRPAWLGQQREIAHFDNLCAQAAMGQGHIDHAEQLFALAVAREREQESELGAYPSLAYPLIGLGHVARCRGDAARAIGCYQEGLTLAARFGDVRAITPGLAGVAGSLAALGRWQTAAALFGASDALCGRAGISFAAHAFAWQQAAGLPEPWQHAFEPHGWLSRLEKSTRDAGKAKPSTLPDAREAERLWAAGRTLALDEVVAMALAMDVDAAHPAPEASASALRRLIPSHDFDLTRREREVLSLLCQRLTDPEIAEKLFISPRTASRHAANIFNKLGVNTRRQAAALATAHGLI